jgi:hypothetical protein
LYCVNQNHIQHIIINEKGTMRVSPCVVIDSTLQNLRTELIEKGRILKKLLKAVYPDVNAVLKAITSIHNLLYHEGRICNVWVTAHVKEDDTRRYITNKKIRAVSILFMFHA